VQSRRSKTGGEDLLVYDYAVGGSQVSGVQTQVENQFLPSLGAKPQWARWNADDTLFGA
jgi:hypothetical protein